MASTKPFSCLLLLLPMFSDTATYAAESPVPTALGPRIGPVLLGFTKSQVEAELGKPERAAFSGDALDPEIRYPGFTIWLGDGERVAQLRSTNPKYCLPGNVCPGTSAAKVLASIGPPREGATLRAGISTYTVISSDDELCRAEITLERDLVSVVEVKCQSRKNSR